MWIPYPPPLLLQTQISHTTRDVGLMLGQRLRRRASINPPSRLLLSGLRCGLLRALAACAPQWRQCSDPSSGCDTCHSPSHPGGVTRPIFTPWSHKAQHNWGRWRTPRSTSCVSTVHTRNIESDLFSLLHCPSVGMDSASFLHLRTTLHHNFDGATLRPSCLISLF